MTFTSVYEILDPLTTVRKQRNWGWFDGDILQSVWGERFSGSGSAVMQDAVDGGYLQQNTSAIGDVAILHQGNIKHYDLTASVLISIHKTNSTTNIRAGIGLVDKEDGGAVDFFLMGIRTVDGSSTDYMLRTNNSGGGSTTAATFTLDTVYHTHSNVCTSSDLQYSIDGGLEVTKTTDRPANRGQIFSQLDNQAGESKTKNTLYIEVYNT